MLQWILFLCVCLVSFPGNEGLDIKVSKQVPYHPLGSNVTVYCTNTFSNELDWFRGPQGKTHLAACTMNHPSSPCLPSAQIYTVDPNNSRYNMNLYNLKYSDCGTYWCKDFDERQSYTLKLIGRVDKIDKQESDGTLSITTNCVLPTTTVDIQWYYIYEGGSPRIYEKHATRTEERGQCQGVCEENNAMKISSSLTPSVVGNNVIQVKFMAYVRQGDNVQQVTFSKEYLIEGCAGSSIWHVMLFIFMPAIFCVVCNVVLITLHGRDSKPLKDIVSNMIAIWICLVMLVCFGIQYAIEEEPTVPDVFGTCHDRFSAKVFVVEVCCILIVFGLMAETIYLCRMNWIQFQQKQLKSNGREGHRDRLYTMQFSTTIDVAVHSGGQEANPLLQQGPSNDSDTDIQHPHGSLTPDENTEKITRQMEETEREEERFEMERNAECDRSLTCMPIGRNKDEQYVYLGGTAVLQCSLDMNNYPSWQGPDGGVINYGGERTFRVKHRFSWHEDKKNLVIKKVQESDAGKYVCFSSDEAVRTVDLIVRLPSEPVEVNSSETATLKVGEKMIRQYPLWRRWNNLNAELHKELFIDNCAWDEDNKGLVIKNISKKDEGEYEVRANHLVKRFTISIKAQLGSEKEQIVEEGATVRLESSCKNDYFPSWECIESGAYNIAGEAHFQSCNRKYANRRLGWDVDMRNLLIQDVRLDDTGTYVCRHSDGTKESVIVIVKGIGQSGERIKTAEYERKQPYLIAHGLGTKFPTLRLVTGNGDTENTVNLAYQNFKTDKYRQHGKNQGFVIIENPFRFEKMAVESSTFRGKIQIHQL